MYVYSHIYIYIYIYIYTYIYTHIYIYQFKNLMDQGTYSNYCQSDNRLCIPLLSAGGSVSYMLIYIWVCVYIHK